MPKVGYVGKTGWEARVVRELYPGADGYFCFGSPGGVIVATTWKTIDAGVFPYNAEDPATQYFLETNPGVHIARFFTKTDPGGRDVNFAVVER